MRQPYQVLVYLARDAGSEWEYLLLRRIPARGGLWQGVTGGLEAGESLAEAAARELAEETGLVPAALAQVGYTYSSPVEDTWREVYGPGVEEIVEYV